MYFGMGWNVAAALEGDQADLMALTLWGDIIAEEKTISDTGMEEDAFTEPFLQDLVKAQMALLLAFDTTEKAHKREHLLTGRQRLRDEAGVDETYRQFIAERRALGVFSIGPLGLGSTPNQQQEWKRATMPRILAGDTGYVSWTAAKRYYIDTVISLVRDRTGADRHEAQFTTDTAGNEVDDFLAYIQGEQPNVNADL
ncbi:hypothetical protein NKR23_g12486 [Pleurostoma richardsiae]|uniref:Uncharacterized protein n=1 Tax=Pleurostoma richardsiae TaxID=41990 RepID=A0AA38R1K9_9PEZI|nr:hypothetical protein NKR23_g12486 [Pleurostoma richardsiae]